MELDLAEHHEQARDARGRFLKLTGRSLVE